MVCNSSKGLNGKNLKRINLDVKRALTFCIEISINTEVF